MTEDEKKAFFMKSSTENPANVGFIAKGDEQKIAGKISESINWAVLVLNDESKKDARKLFKTPLVFSIQEAKGLEFENVILYEFTSHKAYNEMWDIECPGKGKVENTINEIRNSYNERNVNSSRPKNKEDKSFEKHKFYINALYVAVTRAINSVYIIGNEGKCNLLQVIKPGRVSNIDIKKEGSTPEEWRDIALKLIDEGNVEQAKGIAEKLLRERGGGYAKEIMSALKAKEKDHTQESQLPLDKNEQAISELKTENPTPQKSSTMVANEKLKQSSSEKKKLTESELEENTNGLFSVLDKGNLRLAEWLIEQGIDVNAKDGKYEAYLYMAAEEGYTSVVRFLLQHVADVNAHSENGFTPLHISVARGYKCIVELFLGHEKTDVNIKIHGGFTPLYLAVQEGHKEIVELFLNHEKVDVNAMNNKGDAPLHVAVTKDYKEIVELFLSHEKVDVNAQGRNGATPLHIAAIGGNTEVAKLLLEHGARADSIDKSGNTALYLAAIGGHTEVAELLLNHGVDVNARTSEGCTPLALALGYCHSKVVDLLLADPNINVGCVKVEYARKEEDREKFICKSVQDCKLFNAVKQAEKEVDENKVEEIKKLLALKNKHDFKPSLNYSPDGNDENTTIKIAIKVGRKLLQLLYDYAKENIGVDSEIFKRLKYAKENPQPRSSFNDVTTPHNLAQAQVSTT